MKKKVHWTQTPKGRRRMRKRMLEFHNKRRAFPTTTTSSASNTIAVTGVVEPVRTPFEDELLAINHVLMLFSKLPSGAKYYIQQKLTDPRAK